MAVKQEFEGMEGEFNYLNKASLFAT